MKHLKFVIPPKKRYGVEGSIYTDLAPDGSNECDGASLSTGQPGQAGGDPRLGYWGSSSRGEASPFRVDR